MDANTATEQNVVELSEDASWERLASGEVGRLVTHVKDVLDIFPVNYVVDGRTVVFRTAGGTKLAELTVNHEVLFEIDGHNEDEAWSVVLRGRAQRLQRREELAASERLPLKPWIPTTKHEVVRIEPASVSGRWFRRGEAVPDLLPGG